MADRRREHRAVPWRTVPHPWIAFWLLFAVIVGFAAGLFIGPQRGTEQPPSTSYTQTYTGSTP